jgi:PPOX class probable F420-dependent enzyme
VPATVPPEAEELIEDERVIAYLATCADGRPHVAPVWYHYEDGTVEITTTGQKLANVRRNPKVALAFQHDERGHTQWMVTMLGTAEVVEDEDATREATQRINEKYGVHGDAWAENTLVRIDVGSATYRRYDE